MVSIKYSSSTSSSRAYPNTRKHPIVNNSLTTRRQTRLSWVTRWILFIHLNICFFQCKCVIFSSNVNTNSAEHIRLTKPFRFFFSSWFVNVFFLLLLLSIFVCVCIQTKTNYDNNEKKKQQIYTYIYTYSMLLFVNLEIFCIFRWLNYRIYFMKLGRRINKWKKIFDFC